MEAPLSIELAAILNQPEVLLTGFLQPREGGYSKCFKKLQSVFKYWLATKVDQISPEDRILVWETEAGNRDIVAQDLMAGYWYIPVSTWSQKRHVND
jgi:hypothetical protein